MAPADKRQRVEGKSWYRIHAQAPVPAGTTAATRVDLYDEIGLWGVTAKDFLQDLAAIGDGPVDVHIASDGGDVFEAYAIYTALASRPGVTTVVDSLAASSASLIAMAGEQRLMAKLSQMMIHDAWAGVGGNADDLQHMIGRLNTVSGQIAQVYADTAGGTPEHWRGLMKAETWYTPQQALDAGLITGITGTAREPATAGAGAAVAARAGVILAAQDRVPPPQPWDPDGDGDDDSTPEGDTDHSHWSADGKQLKSVPGKPMPGQPPADSARADGNAGWVHRDGEWEFDPDGDGDDDSSPETDTDHDYWSADGTQLKPIPPNPATGNGGQPLPSASRAGPGPQAAAVDNSPWDAGKAWANGAASDDPAAFYNGICAGKKAGDPKTQAAHALPYKYHPGDPPNAAGVRNALSRLPQTQGLTNEAEARATLEAAMKKVNPDWAPPAGSATAAMPSAGKEARMANDDGTLTIEGRRARIDEVKGRLHEMAREYAATVMARGPGSPQEEWDNLIRERDDHVAAVTAHDSRAAQLAAIEGNGDGRSHDGPVAGGQRPAPYNGGPAVHVQSENIYDLAAIRQKARRESDWPGLYRDYALRAIEAARFPGSSREDAQGRVANLLDTVTDDETSVLARRILATGSPEYKRVFGRALKAGNPGALGGHDAQILALGESDTGSYAVPFELDPTVILTSDGAINPLRQMSRVERITGKEFDLVTSAGVTVSRQAEFTEVSSGAPTLTQPTIKPNRVNGFIPFSVELEGDWTALQAEMMRLLADAKDVEEATGSNGFVLGNGTAPAASGIIATLGTASILKTAGTATFAIGDVYATKNGVPPRFRSRGQWLAQSATYDAVRQMGTGSYANVWAESMQVGTPSKLVGYAANEESAMTGTLTSNSKILLFGDFNQFLIVDRVGMNIELIPQVFGTANNYPSGTRGYYAWWRNNSVILVQNAFRLLQVL